jgi:hypothetical protein
VQDKRAVCGTGTGSAGAVTFCLSETGTHYVSSSGSGSKTGFGSDSNIKLNKEVKNIKLESHFLGIKSASETEKQDFVQIFCCWKTVLNIV